MAEGVCGFREGDQANKAVMMLTVINGLPCLDASRSFVVKTLHICIISGLMSCKNVFFFLPLFYCFLIRVAFFYLSFFKIIFSFPSDKADSDE